MGKLFGFILVIGACIIMPPLGAILMVILGLALLGDN